MALPEPAWDDRGLAPAVVQDADTGAVLMLAWMNGEAWARTRESGLVHFWSRSRQALWRKGESSGHELRVVELRLDCDRDAILVRARPQGPTCHTGRVACFFETDDGVDERAPAAHIVDRLERVLEARKHATAQKSYTRALLAAGTPKILAKIAEEHGELAAELAAGAPAKVVHETADLLFHVMVGLVAREVPVADVWRELGRRFGVSGHDEKAARPPKPEPEPGPGAAG
jgi:phosphoribosyl-ATP pyrophosphohydrolase/phosphoribosyl-AMP cyclohydrolase